METKDIIAIIISGMAAIISLASVIFVYYGTRVNRWLSRPILIPHLKVEKKSDIEEEHLRQEHTNAYSFVNDGHLSALDVTLNVLIGKELIKYPLYSVAEGFIFKTRAEPKGYWILSYHFLKFYEKNKNQEDKIRSELLASKDQQILYAIKYEDVKKRKFCSCMHFRFNEAHGAWRGSEYKDSWFRKNFFFLNISKILECIRTKKIVCKDCEIEKILAKKKPEIKNG